MRPRHGVRRQAVSAPPAPRRRAAAGATRRRRQAISRCRHRPGRAPGARPAATPSRTAPWPRNRRRSRHAGALRAAPAPSSAAPPSGTTPTSVAARAGPATALAWRGPDRCPPARIGYRRNNCAAWADGRNPLGRPTGSPDRSPSAGSNIPACARNGCGRPYPADRAAGEPKTAGVRPSTQPTHDGRAQQIGDGQRQTAPYRDHHAVFRVVRVVLGQRSTGL